jgi:hypothetical protein
MDFQFYIKMDEHEFGPYSLDELKELPLLDDTLVTETRLNGEWRPAREFDFHELSKSLVEKKSNCRRNADQSSQWPKICNLRKNDNNEGYAPFIIKKWNWGAFSLSWVWGICNGIYWPIIIIAFNFVPYIGPFVWLVISIYLGIYGNKLAWSIEKKLDSDYLKFTSIQAKWNLAGIIVFIVVLIFFLGKLYISV